MNENIKSIDGKYYDFGTDNESFLQTAAELKSRGVKNYYFMLEIKNPSVSEIKVYDENLIPIDLPVKSEDLVATEINNNLWYYLREICLVETHEGAVEFDIDLGSAASIYLMSKNKNVYLNTPRQTKKTCSIACGVLLWKFYTDISYRSIYIKNGCSDMLYKYSFINAMPKWYTDKYTSYKHSEAGGNRYHMNVRRTNELDVFNASKESDNWVFQGLRDNDPNIIMIDDFEFDDKYLEIISTRLPGFKRRSDRMDDNKPGGVLNHSFILSSTTNYACSDYTIAFIDNMHEWSESMYDMTDKELNVIDKFIHIKYHATDLRISEQWVDNQIKLINNKLISDSEVLLQRPPRYVDSKMGNMEDIVSTASADADIIAKHKIMAYEKYGVDAVHWPDDMCNHLKCGYQYMMHNALIEPDDDISMTLMLKVLKELYHKNFASMVFSDKDKFMKYLDEG